jgi:hypothetical protein
MWSNMTYSIYQIGINKKPGQCYRSVNVITFGVAKGDHIKRLLLYLVKVSIHTHFPRRNSRQTSTEECLCLRPYHYKIWMSQIIVEICSYRKCLYFFFVVKPGVNPVNKILGVNLLNQYLKSILLKNPGVNPT